MMVSYVVHTTELLAVVVGTLEGVAWEHGCMVHIVPALDLKHKLHTYVEMFTKHNGGNSYFVNHNIVICNTANSITILTRNVFD